MAMGANNMQYPISVNPETRTCRGAWSRSCLTSRLSRDQDLNTIKRNQESETPLEILIYFGHEACLQTIAVSIFVTKVNEKNGRSCHRR
jgi:hypothetical protein